MHVLENLVRDLDLLWLRPHVHLHLGTRAPHAITAPLVDICCAAFPNEAA
jgi:hypothetical protein